MKAMKGLSMNKMLGSIKRKPSAGPSSDDSVIDPATETPESTAARSVRQFCESGNSSGEEVTFLPAIVDAAESSPAAAAEAARIIRKFLHGDYWTKPSYQYNAIMLVRILSENPGATFTRNLDKKFVDAVKELLRQGRDGSVRQMLMETLDSFESTKSYDEGLGLVIEMWKKEKEKAYKAYGGVPPPPQARTLNAPPFDPHSQNYFSRSHSNKRLPDPVELANRLEEARTSAKLLEQVVASTPPAEVLSNELIKEFADRCLSASRSIQGYMTAENPSPDNDTMEHLIDTNEQLQTALSQHQRAVLNARKHLGLGARSENPSPHPPEVNESSRPNTWQTSSSSSAAPAPPPRKPVGNGKGKASDRWGANGGGSGRYGDDEEDPFRDPVIAEPSAGTGGVDLHDGPSTVVAPSARPSGAGAGAIPVSPVDDSPPRLGVEPFHPGFGTTPSFQGRQDSAYNKTHMHGAGGSSSFYGEDKETEVDEGSAGGGGSSSRGGLGIATGGGGSSGNRRYAYEDEEEENMYDATPKKTEPSFRY